jgi:hypothetical protein
MVVTEVLELEDLRLITYGVILFWQKSGSRLPLHVRQEIVYVHAVGSIGRWLAAPRGRR